jgi:predicted dinucleotide-binding enzyme
MKRSIALFITAGILGLGLAAFAQTTAKDDMKNAGKEVKQAGKDTASATKKTAKKTGKAVKKTTNKAAAKVEEKTRDK